MQSVFKKFTLFFLFLFALSLCACSAEKHSFTGFSMGSVITADIYADAETARALWQTANTAVCETDARISATNENSEISLLNRGGSGVCSAETLRILNRSLELGRMSGGSLDVTLGAVTALWGFSGEKPSLPDADALAVALQTVGDAHIEIDVNTRIVTLTDGAQLDLGAVGKGAGADVFLDALRRQTRQAVVNFGGTVLLYGKPVGKKSWTVGVRDPFGAPDAFFATYAWTPRQTEDALFVSTSGSYEKQFVADGKTYHHILDPATGFPVETPLISVTVFSAEGLLSDALSTACFVSGLRDETLSLLRSCDAGAVFVFQDKTVFVTGDLADRFRIADPDFQIKTDL